MTKLALAATRIPMDTLCAGPNDGRALRLLRQPVRLAIVRALLNREILTFSEVKRMMQLTDGNLSTHVRRLEEAGIVSCTKHFRRRLPCTQYQLTPAGRIAVKQAITDLVLT